MKRLQHYQAPHMRLLSISLEKGFSGSVDSDFEQPEYGGSTDM